MATDAEIIALVDALAAASRDVARAKTRVSNALEDRAAAEAKVSTRKGELDQAQALEKQARQALNLAIDTRVAP